MNAIEIKDVTKAKKGFSLDNISLSLPEGMIMGLIGENGAGKTTLIDLLMGLEKPDRGEISILGKDIRQDFHITKQDIGVVFDKTGICPDMKISYINRIMKDIYTRWDEQQFFGFAERFELPRNKSFRHFSAGMKMKLGIAVAMSHHARLLIMDEPASGLDLVSRQEVNKLLFDFTRDESCSALIASHMLGDLEKVCDHIAFLHRGRLLICEEKDRLYEEYGVLKCNEKDLAALPEKCIIGKNDTRYGLELMVKRSLAPMGLSYSAPDLETLFLYIAGGDARESAVET